MAEWKKNTRQETGDLMATAPTQHTAENIIIEQLWVSVSALPLTSHMTEAGLAATLNLGFLIIKVGI